MSGLALLTKVPALLDAGALGSIFFFIVVAYITPKTWKTVTLWFIQAGSIFVGGVFLPLVLSMVYFWLRGAIADYLQFGLLYNLHYSGNWTLPFTQEWLVAAFSLPGKALVLGVVLLISIAWARWKPQQSEAAWIYFWTFAALFAATLSNRPYPHYLLQTILPAAFALGILLRKHSHWIARVMMVDAIGAIIVVLILLDFGLYNTGEYYWRYIKMGSGQISPQEYRHEFDWLVSQNEEIVPIIVENTQPSDRIFLWGTNAMLYAQAQRAPATRFTVAFHVHDLDVYEQTMEEVRTAEPKFIVVMKSESELPGLSEYLHQYYLVSAETNDMILYRRTTLSSLDLLQ
ncbi:hypothetical protein LRY65_04120 [Candidatus Woesebacteria bacterium]|nr:hypothetical protein [Candidatus Woesebacteria bacterium]MCD8546113.1 hypothetical protein [Candidatus Woesebacteria bacterium]